MSDIYLNAPLSREDARNLKLGDVVFLSGEIITSAGFPTHKRILEYMEAGKEPPLDLHGAAFFHMGSMSREENGKITPLYANPTTSTRFNDFMPRLIEHFGLTATAGKGGLDERSVEAMKKSGCVYFSMIGGGAPMLSEGFEETLETGWDDLIMQFRLTRFRVKNFGPLTVAIDAHGNSTYANLTNAAKDRLPQIMAALNAAREG